MVLNKKRDSNHHIIPFNFLCCSQCIWTKHVTIYFEYNRRIPGTITCSCSWNFPPVSHLHHHTCASLGSHAVCLAGLSGRAPGGYSWHYMSCPAEDECANGHHGCDVKRQNCVDAPHGYSCRCKQGYELETIHYRDVDDARCVQIIGYIHIQLAVETYTPGAFRL